MLQSPLNVTISQRTPLVTIETARAFLGCDAESVVAKIESGIFRWSFDISTRAAIRELRLWARDLIAPSPHLDTPFVINCIIGTSRERLRAVEVADLILCSRPTIHRLVKLGHLSGPLVNHTQHITRDSLVKFLASRLI